MKFNFRGKIQKYNIIETIDYSMNKFSVLMNLKLFYIVLIQNNDSE